MNKFKIYIDTREQTTWSFPEYETERTTLNARSPFILCKTAILIASNALLMITGSVLRKNILEII